MKRNLLQHFVDIAMDSTLAATNYRLIGDGVESLTEEMNGESETKQWINQENGTTDVKSYTPSISIERKNIDQDDTELTDWINNLIDTLPTGKNAITSYVRVRVKGSGPSYPAMQRMCSVTVGSTGGDAGADVADAITLGGRGDGIKGTFNVETKKFTAAAGAAPTSLSE